MLPPHPAANHKRKKTMLLKARTWAYLNCAKTEAVWIVVTLSFAAFHTNYVPYKKWIYTSDYWISVSRRNNLSCFTFNQSVLSASNNNYTSRLLSCVRPICEILDEEIRGASSSTIESEAEPTSLLFLSSAFLSNDFFSNIRSCRPKIRTKQHPF